MSRVNQGRIHDVQRYFEQVLCSKWSEDLRRTSTITDGIVVAHCAIVGKARLVQFSRRLGVEKEPMHSYSNLRGLSERLDLLPFLSRLGGVTPSVDPVNTNFSAMCHNLAQTCS